MLTSSAKRIQQAILLFLLLLLLPATGWAQRQRQTRFENGTLVKGQKTGIWEYYSYTRTDDQVIVQKYDHTAHKLLYYAPIEEINYEVEKQPGQWVSSPVDQPPLFLGGSGLLSTYLSALSYPESAQLQRLQGKVIIEFTIDTLGHASAHKVLARVGGGCDEEALRVCKSIPDQWLAPRIGSRAVPVKHQLPFTFRLQ